MGDLVASLHGALFCISASQEENPVIKRLNKAKTSSNNNMVL